MERGKQEPLFALVSPFRKVMQTFGPPGKDLTTTEANSNGVLIECLFSIIEATMASMHIFVAIV